jgi:hypothetical protein
MSQDIFIGIQPFTGDNIYITPDASIIEQVNVNVQPFFGEEVYINVQPETTGQINISVSPNLLGVQLVNGKDGIVTLDKTDIGLSNVENISIINTSGYLQYEINNINDSLTGYSTKIDLQNSGENIIQKINILSGQFDENNILGYTFELNSGIENLFIPYPFYLNKKPSSITCSLQNFIDNIIYHYTIGQSTLSGFFINFSDILTNSGYLLNVKIKK